MRDDAGYLAWTQAPRGAMLFDPRRVRDPGPALFDPGAYGAGAQPVGAGGRQAAWFVQGGAWQGVLRHFRRGGLAARVSRDAYVWRGEAATRSFAEYRLLQALHRQGLPVPAPLAAAYWRRPAGPLYRAAILVERLPGVQPLADRLPRGEWTAVAGAVVALHRAGAWHADLNAYNILLDPAGKAWLVDFDRGRAGGVSGAQRRGNLERLRRSLRKVGGDEGLRYADRLEAEYRALWDAGPA